MGYTTWFTGHLKFDKPLAPPHLTYLRAFNEMPHVYWDVELIKDVPDPIREAVGLPLGENGCYFTGEGFRSRYSFTGCVYRGAPDPGYL
ncbi:hypothetical protein [Ktedonobacter racemifer]|uniref:S-layer domain protein n=1 Tax=Ktedonobacter racemifer DSM 44963 TaxID=485913 RepID=D6TZX1_KTERA|nr:hypothetical protein [Ktedonobacter racemifer]EFH82111.1 S-layer domain protein [Ktedonobacter racemifer DSM 44963]